MRLCLCLFCPQQLNCDLAKKFAIQCSLTNRRKMLKILTQTTRHHTIKNFPLFVPRRHCARNNFDNDSDVAVIGGGVIGASTAYWLKEKTHRGNKNLSVVVIEKDPTYSRCSTARSVGGMRQQFSLPENIRMSLFGADFLKNIKGRFGPDADVSFLQNGYLILASKNGAAQMEANYELQQNLQVRSSLLTKEQLKTRFPWLNVEDVELGCLGGDTEGWFDPWGLLTLFKKGAVDKGAQFIHGEVTDFVFENDHQPSGVVVKLPDGKSKTIGFKSCVLAAGCESGNVAKLAKIGAGPEKLSVCLPVERRKRYVYQFDSKDDNAPPKNSPLVIDYTGVYFRSEGSSYITGASPKPEDEPSTDNLDVDHSFFENTIWPQLAARIPAFENLKVKNAWGGFYEYNCYDKNGVIGVHPCYPNFYFATGFSGHGIQQAPAVGLAVAELIVDGAFRTIDLTRLGFDRLITDKPMREIGIY